MKSEPSLLLTGPDGGNPLGFLAALGTLVSAARIWPGARMGWQAGPAGWRAALSGCGEAPEPFLDALHGELRQAQMAPFAIDGKLPFPVALFRDALAQAAARAAPNRRRECDLLAGLGSELGAETDPKKPALLRDTPLRMVRSGDSAGQGLPVYARAIRAATGVEHLRRTLFAPWDYRDDGFSLRWDPLEDQRYALRWRDPSKAGAGEGPGVMIGANSLAIEALACLPVVAVGKRIETVGFTRIRTLGLCFTWPIWEGFITPDTVRSLLALPALQQEPDRIPHEQLAAMGVVELFRSRRIQQNQYYSNFAPAQAV